MTGTSTKELEENLVVEETQVEEECQVVLHCRYNPEDAFDAIRIWQSTFLFDKDSPHKSPLLHAINISIFPRWKIVPKGKTFQFTLIFSGLPKSCKVFDFVEDIPESGGFAVYNIPRNKSDIYEIEIF